VYSDVEYFVTALADVGYLKTTDPVGFAEEIYLDVNTL